jgi:hypothetical protein
MDAAHPQPGHVHDDPDVARAMEVLHDEGAKISARIDPIAEAYAKVRRQRDETSTALTAVMVESPEAKAIARLREDLAQAEAAFKDANDRHPLHAALVEAQRTEELGRAALLEAWPVLLRSTPGTPKTVEVPGGQVQIRVTAGVEVTDPVAAVKSILALGGLAKAAIKDVKVDAKLLRPIIDADPLAGLQAKDGHSIAWIPEA